MENYFDKMQLNDVFNRVKARKKISNSGWMRIPAITSMITKLGQYNDFLTEVGIKRRMPTSFKFTDHSNKHMNRYMTYQIRRLELLRDEGKVKKF